MSINDAESLTQHLECGVYHAHLDPHQCQLAIDVLSHLSAVVLVRTSVLSSGVDFNDITMSIYWHGASSLIETIQHTACGAHCAMVSSQSIMMLTRHDLQKISNPQSTQFDAPLKAYVS